MQINQLPTKSYLELTHERKDQQGRGDQMPTMWLIPNPSAQNRVEVQCADRP